MARTEDRRLQRPLGGRRHLTLIALAAALAFSPNHAHAQGLGAELVAPGGSGVGDFDETVPAAPGSEEATGARYPLPRPEAAAEHAPNLRVSSRVTTRLRHLDGSLRYLARQQAGGNVVNAVLNMLTGGFSITLGALLPNPTDFLSIYLYVYGGAAALRGVFDLVLTPDASGDAITFQHMPMTTREELDERLRFGEGALQSLADRALLARVVDASINLAAGVAVVPIFLAPTGFEINDLPDYLILIGAAVSVVGGVIALVSPSPAEQRLTAYQQLRERLEAERLEELGEDAPEDDTSAAPTEPPSSRWALTVAPTPTGGFGGFALTF